MLSLNMISRKTDCNVQCSANIINEELLEQYSKEESRIGAHLQMSDTYLDRSINH